MLARPVVPASKAGIQSENELYIEAYPNPVKYVLYISIESSSSETATIQIMDAQGKNIITLTSEIQSGKTMIKTNVTELPGGLYILNRICANKQNYY